MKKFLFFPLLFLYINSFAQTWINNTEIISSGNVRVYSSDIDNSNNIYAVGHFQNSIGDTLESYGDFDFFVAKYDQSLQLQWIKKIGSSKREFASVQTVLDKDNNVLVSGVFQDTCLFNNALDTLISDGLNDVFILRYSSSGDFISKKNVVRAPSYQWITSIEVDFNNNILIAGYYKDSCIIENDTLYGSGVNTYIAKFSNDGNIIWNKNIISTANGSNISSVRAFNDGYYFNGQFSGDLYLDIKTLSSYISDKRDVYLYKTDFDGNGLWVRQSYGNNNDYTGTITQDEYGNVYYSGYFSGTEFFADSTGTLTSNVTLSSTNGSDDIFINKYNKNGNLLWTRGYGGIGNDVGKVILSHKNKLYISGYFSDEVTFGEDTINSSSSSDNDIFVAGLDNLGNTIFASSLYADGGNDHGDILEISSDGISTVGGGFIAPSITIGEETLFNSTGTYNGILAQFIPELEATFTQKTNPTCNGSTDGELVVTPYFGVSPYTYSWSHDAGLNDSTATGLAAGTYSVTVTDDLDSTAVAQYTLTEPDPFIFNPSITHVTTCSYSPEGAIDINVTGGNGGNSYYWFESDGGSGVSLTSEDQTGLTVGTYHVTVTDEEGCTADTTMYVTGPEPVTFDGSVVTSYTSPLDLGAINLAYQGGTGTVTFSWEGPSGFTATTEDITDLDPGSYTVTATDDSGCMFDTTFKVLDESVFYAYISEQKDACQGTTNGKATVSYFSPDGTISANITYQWDAAAGGQTTAEATNLDAGTYSVTVTDTDLGVDDIVSVTIEELSYTFDGEIDPSSTTVLDCSGDTDGYIDVTITPPGGETPYTYAWNTGAATQDLINIGTGTYSVTVTDANECQFTIPNYEITEPAALLTSADVLKRPTCHGDYDGELEAAASGGTGVYAYLWNDPGSQNSKIANGLDAGFYTVTVTDANGCQNSSSVNLTQPPPIEIDETVYDISCAGETDGAVQLATTGGTPAFSYFWNTNDGSGLDQTGQNQAGLTAGKYYFTATDAHNCLYEDSVKIIEPPALQIIDETVNDASSASATDGSVTVEATGGTGTLTFTLTPGSIGNETGIFGNLSPGDYTVEVTDINSCGPVTTNLTVGYPNAIESVHAADNIRLYPNPTSSKITIAIDSEQAASYTFEILNISGQRLLKETTQSSGDLLKEFDLSEYAKGIYFIKVSTEDLYYQEKVIFQ